MLTGFEIDLKRCTECRRCMIACSIAQTERVDMKESRIFVDRAWPGDPVFRVCRFDDCEGHPCIESCPVDAIRENGGTVVIDEEECIGCRACIDACPYDAITFIGKKAWKCDFCGGEPACVPECATQAIRKKGE